MLTQVKLIWHQFKKETREHRKSLLVILSIVTGYSALAASGRLETIESYWSYPALLENPMLPLLFTMGPALVLVPFVAFSDSCSEPDAYWITKPLGSLTVVGAKIAWISVWLIAVPLLAECLIVLSLGGNRELPGVILDFIVIRMAYFFTVFTLACLFNQILQFTIALVSIPIVGSIISATNKTFSGESVNLAVHSPSEGSILFMWCMGLALVMPIVAIIQYHFRLRLQNAALLAVGVFVAGATLSPGPIDIYDRQIPPREASTLGIDKLRAKVESALLIPKPLTPTGLGRDQLQLNISLQNLPPLAGLLLNSLQLTISTPQNKVVIRDDAHNIETYQEIGHPLQRISANIIGQLDGQPPSFQSVSARILVTLPRGERASDWRGRMVSISGRANFDVFTHMEFGRLQLRNSPNREARLERQGNAIMMRWQPETPEYRHVAFQHRQIFSNFAVNGCDARSKWNPSITRWHFIFHDRESNTFHDYRNSGYTGLSRGPSFCALQMGRSTMNLPRGTPLDEVIVYESKYLGTVNLEFNHSHLSLKLTE